MTTIAQIANGEAGSSVRTKLNQAIDAINTAPRTISGATFTTQTSDDQDVIFTSSSSGVTGTLHATAQVGETVTVITLGTGTVTFVAAAGGTRVSRGSLYSTAGQYSAVTAICTANSGGSAAAWLLVGDLA